MCKLHHGAGTGFIRLSPEKTLNGFLTHRAPTKRRTESSKCDIGRRIRRDDLLLVGSAVQAGQEASVPAATSSTGEGGGVSQTERPADDLLLDLGGAAVD